LSSTAIKIQEDIVDIDAIDTTIESLGEPRILSPLQETGSRAMEWNFISDSERTLVDVTAKSFRKYIKENKRTNWRHRNQ
jgi:hypothetical protein